MDSQFAEMLRQLLDEMGAGGVHEPLAALAEELHVKAALRAGAPRQDLLRMAALVGEAAEIAQKYRQ